MDVVDTLNDLYLVEEVVHVELVVVDLVLVELDVVNKDSNLHKDC